MMEFKRTRVTRSRSKTPTADFEPMSTRSGRKTPTVISSTQTQIDTQPIIIEENEEVFTSPPAHRTRNALKHTSDYSSEEQENSPNRLVGFTKEQSQNFKNYSYEEHIYTTQSEKADSIQSTQELSQSHHYHTRSQVSPSQSDTSFKSSFAELTLADVSKIRELDDSDEQLPYKLYKYAGEYWNKYPKTDYTYSRRAKDYVELAPGQIAMPNMSRRSLQNFRLYGTAEADSDYTSTPSLAADSLLKTNWNDYDGLRKRTSFQENNEQPHHNGSRFRYQLAENDHYWLTRILISVWTKIITTVTTITTTTTNTNTEAYPYYGNQAASTGNGIIIRFGKGLAAPFVFLASKISRFCSIENISTISSSAVGVARKRKYWYFLIPLLLLFAWSQTGKESSGLQTFRIENVHKHIVQILGLKPQYTEKRPLLAKSDVLGWINDELERKLANLKAELSIDIKQSERNQQESAAKMADSLKIELEAWREGIIRDIRQEISLVSTKETKEVNIIYKHDEDRMKKIISEILAIYDADKTGRVDYAMESAGGQVISIRCTESYQARTAQISILGVPIWWPSNSPRVAITPGSVPGECWAFQGFPGYLVIRLYSTVNVTGFTMDHVTKLLAPEGKIESAPKNFSVWGLMSEMDAKPHKFGDYMYDENSTAVQYFPVKSASYIQVSILATYPVAYDLIELRIETNYGNPTYTCLYRFRVHGDKVDRYIPSDVSDKPNIENR